MSLWVSGTPAAYAVVAVYNESAPATVVQFQAFALPLAGGTTNVSFTNLNPGVYNVVTYASPDGNPDGVIMNQFIAQANYTTATIIEPIYLVVGDAGGPVAGTTEFDATAWATNGWTIDVIERQTFGTLIDVAQNPSRGQVQYLNSGGFKLITVGDSFQYGETFIVKFQPQIVTSTGGSTNIPGVVWSGVDLITANTTLTNGDMGRLKIVQGTGITVNINLPVISTVPNGTYIGFKSDGGNHFACNLVPQGGDTVKYIGDTWSLSDPFTLCQGEECWLFTFNSAWWVSNAVGAWKNIGRIYTGFALNDATVLMPAGLTDAFAQAQYPRLYRWIGKYLDPVLVQSNIGAWAAQNNGTTGSDPMYKRYKYTGNFYRDTSLKTFGIPLLCQLNDGQSTPNTVAGGFLRGVTGTSGNKAGQTQYDRVGNFASKMVGKRIMYKGAQDHDLLTFTSPALTNPDNSSLTFTAQSDTVKFAGYWGDGQTTSGGVGSSPNGETTPYYTSVYYGMQY